jgi:hypothetical protein
MLSTTEIDRELSSRTKEVANMASTLVELDNHPGLQHVRRYTPTGVTAQRWAVVESAVAQLWQDLGRMTSILESAQTVRGRRSKLDDDDRAELTKLLRARSVEVARRPIPLSRRAIGAPDELVEYAGLVDTANRMRDIYPAVVEFLDAVDEIDTLIARGLAPSQKKLDRAGEPGPTEIADLLTVSAVDPLSLTVQDVDRRITAIARDVDRRTAELTEIAALRANWPEEVAATAGRLDELRAAVQRAAEIRARAGQKVAGSLPVPPDVEPNLRAELGAITTPDPAALRSLRHRIGDALLVVGQSEALAQGLLDRRGELKGRLTAYQAKAARLGLGEDRDLLSSGRTASGLLSRRPCDLHAVTRAIVDYQQTLAEKRGQTR